jgi:hypothetical protein
VVDQNDNISKFILSSSSLVWTCFCCSINFWPWCQILPIRFGFWSYDASVYVGSILKSLGLCMRDRPFKSTLLTPKVLRHIMIISVVREQFLNFSHLAGSPLTRQTSLGSESATNMLTPPNREAIGNEFHQSTQATMTSVANDQDLESWLPTRPLDGSRQLYCACALQPSDRCLK